MYHGEYTTRELDIQIRIDNIQRSQNYKYPLSWYASLSDSQIRAMHTQLMVEYAKSLEGQIENGTFT